MTGNGNWSDSQNKRIAKSEKQIRVLSTSKFLNQSLEISFWNMYTYKMMYICLSIK